MTGVGGNGGKTPTGGTPVGGVFVTGPCVGPVCMSGNGMAVGTPLPVSLGLTVGLVGAGTWLAPTAG